MKSKNSIGYTINIEGARITVSLFDVHKGSAVGHSRGISEATEIGTLLAIDAGTRALVFRVDALSFAEPKDAHRIDIGSGTHRGEPLRHMIGSIVGFLKSNGDKLVFEPSSLVSPPLGAEVYPLTDLELSTIRESDAPSHDLLNIGKMLKSGEAVNVNIADFLSKHVAVLGGTGQGKSCFTASILQQLIQSADSRIVIFDINGEYRNAFNSEIFDDMWINYTKIGRPEENGENYRIPYYALGRHGLQRLLIPSEKTQRPALNFALDHLNKVKWFENERGLGLIDSEKAYLFDDCRPGIADQSKEIIDKLRSNKAESVQQWPPMIALSALIAESHSLMPDRNGNHKRDPFSYGNVAPLINRIHRYIEDPMFTAVVDVEGANSNPNEINWKYESKFLVEKIFGSTDSQWRVHIVDLRAIPHDLSPFILGSLLDMYAFELFERGQVKKIPTLLVLEEAHHYLRNMGNVEDNEIKSIAYERLAKEGRKFGLALWLSTQRPSEISTTVLSQCNNWVCFRLTSEKDLSKVSSANDWANKHDVYRIAGLSRRQALVFGGSLKLPFLIESNEANPLPLSEDANFSWKIGSINDKESENDQNSPIDSFDPFEVF